MEKIIKLTDESELKVGLVGDSDSATIMLPVAKPSVYGQAADNLRHRLQHPNPENLTPDNIVKDLLAIADAMNVKKFNYYGYSWLALVGLQLAVRTDRLESLIMGGFPPIEGPYKEMMVVTSKTYGQGIISILLCLMKQTLLILTTWIGITYR